MSHCELTIDPRLDCTDPAERAAGDAEALQKLARRIRTFPEGEYTPTPPPRLLHELTDEVLVIASDAVSGVGREQPALSGNATLRLLAWTVADASGATVALDKPLALTVGKRLDRQAQSVRANFAAISGRAREARLRVSAAAAGNPALAATLEREIAQIDVKEQSAMSVARTEVYVGFHELASLLPENEVEEAALEPPPAPVSTPPAATTSARVLDSPEPFLHFPFHCDASLDPVPLPIPRDLAGALGPDVSERLCEHLEELDSWGNKRKSSGDWWSLALPSFACHLARQKAQLTAQLTATEQSCDELVEKLTADHRRSQSEARAELEDVHAENEDLRMRLHVSAGEVKALRGVITLCRWGADGPA